MPLKLADKELVVAEVAKIAATAQSAIAAEYRGMSVTAITSLRAKARQADVYLRVIKNTLAKRAIADTSFACMSDTLVGPIVLAFSLNDPGAAARVISEFAKTNDKLKVKSLSVGGQLLDGKDIDKLATLPTYDQAISMLMSVIQAPITQLVRTMAEPHAKLVRTVAAVRDSKQEAA
jgi:large subunit ribosomal protein L10